MTPEAKSIRLDVYVNDEKQTIYNIEMQTYKIAFLPKRMRYYQAMTDLNVLDKGISYSALPTSYIIFICTYDPFNKGNAIYTFENLCANFSNLPLGDMTKKIVLNTKGTKGDISKELRSLLAYFEDNLPNDEFTDEIHKEVNKARNNDEWRREYMTLMMRDEEMREEGRISTIIDLYIEKILSLEISLEKTGLSKEDFLNKVNEYKIANNIS